MLTSMIWLYLALLAPLLYAVLNLIDDNMLRYVYRGPQPAAVISGLFGIIPAVLVLAFSSTIDLPGNLILLSIGAGYLTVVGYYFYFVGLERENPSVVAALFSLTPAIIPFLAHHLVNERLSISAIVGFIILIVTTFIYSLSDIKKFTPSKALIPVTAAALLLDGIALANKYIYTKADFYAAYFYFSIGMVVGGLFFWWLIKQKGGKASGKAFRLTNSVKVFSLLILVELLGLAAEFVQDRALSLGSVSLVKALENLQPIYVLMIAVLLYPFFPKYFREAQSGNAALKTAMLVTMAVGAYMAVR